MNKLPSSITAIHQEVFDYLSKWSEEARAKEYHNPFFYMRTAHDDGFKQGWWFPGNNDALYISFWTGGNLPKSSPNIYFEISHKGHTRFVLTAGTVVSKQTYFAEMAAHLGKEYDLPLQRNPGEADTWATPVNKAGDRYLEALEKFIGFEKELVDNYVIANPYMATEEFVTHIGFINASEFERMYARVKEKAMHLHELEQTRGVEQHKGLPGKDLQQAVTGLPLTIKRFSISGYQGIQKATVENLPARANWVFLTGENGYGKTSVMQALALALNGDTLLDNYVDASTFIETEVIFHDKYQLLLRSKSGTPLPSQEQVTPHVLGYGPARLNIQPDSSENADPKLANNVMSLFNNSVFLKNIRYELFATNHADSAVFGQLENALRDISNGRIQNIVVSERNVLFVEQLGNGDVLPAQPLEKLAAGFRSIINLVADIIIRLGKNYPIHTRYQDFFGIVLIDELENHLHPVLQRELPATLTKVFPCIQFIASTHSPIPLLGAPKNSVILTVSRDKERGVTIERMDDKIDFPNLLPNAIFSSPIFGFDKMIAEAAGEPGEVETADSYSEVEVMRNLKKSIGLLKLSGAGAKK